MTSDSLAGAQILHIEDEVLIALEVESICLENGASNVRHVADIEAISASDLDGFDVVVIDLSLRGKSTLPLADMIDQRGIAMVFMSGQDRTAVADRFPTAQFVDKPFKAEDVIDAISKCLASRRSRSI